MLLAESLGPAVGESAAQPAREIISAIAPTIEITLRI
jgi:hypothetical protein